MIKLHIAKATNTVKAEGCERIYCIVATFTLLSNLVFNNFSVIDFN